jgi:hypothetical protein
MVIINVARDNQPNISIKFDSNKMYIRDELKGSSYLVYDIQTVLRSAIVDIIDGGSSTITGVNY